MENSGGYKSEDVVAAEVIKDCKISFNVKTNPPDLGITEVVVIRQWLS